MKESFVNSLLKFNIIKEEELEKAIQEQWEKGGSLEEYLIRLGYFNEDSLLNYICRRFGYPSIELDSIEIDEEVIKLVPEWLARKYYLVPLRRSLRSLAVAMMNPLDSEAIDALQKLVYQEILPFVAKKSEIEKVINKYYKKAEQVKMEYAGVPASMKKYTFDNFVTGKCNDFAYSVALSVARGFSESTNPLFIYSDVGLGKTHLLIAIWNYIVEHAQPRKVFFSSASDFITKLNEAIEQNNITKFRSECNSYDVLLIDDIGLIAGNEVAQHHFFLLFNDFYLNNKQIVVTSDRPPKELPSLSQRLQSRLESGVLCKINPPDLETRIAILKFKLKSINISADVLHFIGEKITRNVRDLEAIVKEIMVLYNYKKDIDIEDIKIIIEKRML